VAQRLLAMADAAASSVGGDPFCVASPSLPIHTAAAAADKPGSGSSSVAGSVCSNICGSQHEWRECLERVRLAHEAMLLLRALVASPGAIGEQCAALLV
jgi:hypothetical protein